MTTILKYKWWILGVAVVYFLFLKKPADAAA